jgi:hypothetical protein
LAVFTGLHWNSPRWNDDYIGLLADIAGTSAGIAVAFTIVVEGLGSMVLLIPARIKKLKDQGRAEGRKAQKDRLEEAYKRFGFEVDGKLVLPRTPEVEEFLSGNTDNRS